MKNIFLLILAIAIESCKPELHDVHLILLNDHEMMVNDNKINIDNFGEVFSLEILNSQKGSGKYDVVICVHHGVTFKSLQIIKLGLMKEADRIHQINYSYIPLAPGLPPQKNKKNNRW